MTLDRDLMLLIVGAGIGFVPSLLIAILGPILVDRIRSCFYKPELCIEVGEMNPYCTRMPIVMAIRGEQKTAYGYQLRFKVKNTGNRPAEEVEVYAAKLYRVGEEERPHASPFLPMNLKWSDYGQPFVSRISPKMSRLCDLGQIVRRSVFPYSPVIFEWWQEEAYDPEAVLILSTMVPPSNLSHIIPPGIFRLELQVAAANCRPVTKTLEIDFMDAWSDNVYTMLKENLNVRVVG